MARLARVGIPDVPHHVIQRGVRSMAVFGSEADRQTYLRLLAAFGRRAGVSFWAWCLMTNPVHLVAVPARPESLARAIGEAHRRYSRHVNRREGVRGHLPQERFHSFPMQADSHVLTVVRDVERNPVRAGMVQQAVDSPWSSARHHMMGASDPLVTSHPIRQLVEDGGKVLWQEEGELGVIRRHVRTGRPFGDEGWLSTREQQVGRPLRPRRGGWPKGRPRKVG